MHAVVCFLLLFITFSNATFAKHCLKKQTNKNNKIGCRKVCARWVHRQNNLCLWFGLAYFDASKLDGLGEIVVRVRDTGVSLWSNQKGPKPSLGVKNLPKVIVVYMYIIMSMNEIEFRYFCVFVRILCDCIICVCGIVVLICVCSIARIGC